MKVLELFKKIHTWFNEGTVVEEVSNIFTFVTIINSYMMVAGWDQPKLGVFAYVHLLSRLAIIMVVIGLWEVVMLWQCGVRGVAAINIAKDVNTVIFIKVMPKEG